MVEDSYRVITQNNEGMIIADYKGRAKIKKDILEAAGILKPAWWQTINFFQQVFQWKTKPREQWADIVESL